jgi:2-polyprenyl-3-methyl-5-hydroxy-6-metoxy-1,4-benzoquinol methylase
MINRMFALWQRPERGWDPVPEDHARAYAEHEWSHIDYCLVERINAYIGGLAGKTVLDLGAGPGHYAVTFALKGAEVTWYDISRNYLQIASQKAAEHRVSLEFVIGYLDEAYDKLKRQYDLVFNKGCFNYAWADAPFARTIYLLVKPGGYGYIRTNNAFMGASQRSTFLKIRYWLYQHLNLKIGHPYPPRGKLARLLLRYPIEQMVIDYTLHDRDIIFFKRAACGDESEIPASI